jgi:hypothetical protein
MVEKISVHANVCLTRYRVLRSCVTACHVRYTQDLSLKRTYGVRNQIAEMAPNLRSP